MPHDTRKTDEEDANAPFNAQVPASCAAKFPGGIERGRSENNAVPGEAVTKDEILPLGANGDMQILDTRSTTLKCPR